MSLRETLLVIVRRWRLSVPAFVLSVILAAGTFVLIRPSYVAEEQLLILASPTAAGIDEPTNPFLNFGSTLVSTAGVVTLTVQAPQVVEALEKQGFSAEYEVKIDDSTPAPILLVTATDADPGVASRTADAVTDEVKKSLDAVQEKAGAPRDTWVRTDVLFRSPKAKIQRKSQIRAVIVVFAGALTVTALALFLIEGRAQRRARAQAFEQTGRKPAAWAGDRPPAATTSGRPPMPAASTPMTAYPAPPTSPQGAGWAPPQPQQPAAQPAPPPVQQPVQQQPHRAPARPPVPTAAGSAAAPPTAPTAPAGAAAPAGRPAGPMTAYPTPHGPPAPVPGRGPWPGPAPPSPAVGTSAPGGQAPEEGGLRTTPAGLRVSSRNGHRDEAAEGDDFSKLLHRDEK